MAAIARKPARLRRAMQLTILACLSSAVLMAIG